MRTVTLFVAAALAASAQQPKVENAKLETRNFAGSLASQFSGFGAGPWWAAYSEAIIPGQQGDLCWYDGNRGDARAPGTPMRLEGPTALVVLVRMEGNVVSRIRTTSPDCLIDAGGLPFYWITNVPPSESVNWLKAQANGISAIALTAGPEATRALEDLTATSQPDKVRERAAFWLGNSRGAEGLRILERMLANDPNRQVRERVIFAMTQSKEPAAMAKVIDTARNDKDTHVRGQALFWMAQRAAAQQARDAISAAVRSDPDAYVRERAVFALTQIPNGEGVPQLIELARNSPDAAVKKKAMFWLGQSKDPRAVEFFAQVLKP
jgi:HEAT repeat protein